MPIELKYFVLKPRGNSPFAKASRRAMIEYAKMIRSTDEDMAKQLIDWASLEAKEAAREHDIDLSTMEGDGR